MSQADSSSKKRLQRIVREGILIGWIVLCLFLLIALLTYR